MITLKQQTKPLPEAIQNALLILWRACERIKKEGRSEGRSIECSDRSAKCEQLEHEIEFWSISKNNQPIRV
jgi:hypothetical protein